MMRLPPYLFGLNGCTLGGHRLDCQTIDACLNLKLALSPITRGSLHDSPI
jgi:hypothetical protein